MANSKSYCSFLFFLILLFINNLVFSKNYFEIKDKNDIRINGEYLILNTKAQNYIKIKPINNLIDDPTQINVKVTYKISPLNDKDENSILFIDTFLFKVLKNESIKIKIPQLNEGQYFLNINIESNDIKEEKIIVLKVESKKWLLLSLSGLLGGLAIFLFGCNFLSSNLRKSASYQFQNILNKLSKNKLTGFISGIIFTFIFQSSSATSVMLVSLVNSGIINLSKAIPILFGSAVGTTLTVQIIAFKLTDYALLILALGFLMNIIEKPLLKNIGGAILGLGFIFYGMHIMSTSMQPFKNVGIIANIILKLENPLIGILVGLILTAIIQSSAAFIGIILTLSTQNLISLNASIPLILGTNIGTTITAILASINSSRESKQVAISYFLFKFLGIFFIIPWIDGFANLVKSLTYNIAEIFHVYNLTGLEIREIANAHTIYNTLIALLFLVFSNSLEKLVYIILPPRKEKETTFKTLYLDYSLTRTPSLAVSAAKREVIRMMKNVQEMVDIIILAFINKDRQIIEKINEKEKEINLLRDEINNYLVLISKQENDKKLIEEIFQIMFIINEFEHIADIVSINMCNKAITWINSDNIFSNQGLKEIIFFHKNTLEIFERVIQLYQNFNYDEAKKIKQDYKEYRKLVFELEKSHFERLKNDIKESIESSKVHIELITMLKLIASHLVNSIRILSSKDYNYDKDRSTN